MKKVSLLLVFIFTMSIAQNVTIAVLDFENNGGLEPSEVKILSARLQSEIVKAGGYKVVERKKIDKIFEEQKFQMSECVVECLIEVGMMLGAEQIVIGDVGKFGSTYTINARLVDATTGEIIRASNFDTDDNISDLLKMGMLIIATELSGKVLPSQLMGDDIVLQLKSGTKTSSELELSTSTVDDMKSLDGRQEVTERWPNGLKKTVMVYKGSGVNETAKKLGFTKDGKPDYIMEPAAGWTYKYYYNENGDIKKEGANIGSVNDTTITVGVWTYYHSNGLKLQEVTYLGTKEKPWKRDGPSIRWHDNGQKSFEGTYNDGERDGLNTTWFENGQKSFEGTYNDGERDGLHTEWYENGQKSTEGTFKDGEKHGLWTTYYANQQIKDIGTYENGVYNGKWTFYYENGNKEKEGTLQDGNAHDKWIFYNEKGEKTQEGLFGEGVKHGKWIAYFEDGKLTEGEYKNGKKDGTWTSWWDYDKTRKEMQGTYKTGKMDGLWTFYKEDGTVYEVKEY